LPYLPYYHTYHTQAARAARDGLVGQRTAAVQEVESKFAKMLEVKAEMQAQKQAIIDRAENEHKRLFSQKPAAGGATSADGAAALDRVNGVADDSEEMEEAEETAEAEAAEAAAAEAAEAAEAEEQRAELEADFAGF
jgi:hypothetical protein